MASKVEPQDFLNSLTKLKLFKIIDTLDNRIMRNLSDDGIKTRPASCNGLWCCVLLPTVLALFSVQCEVSLLYRIVACLSIGMFCYCLLFIVFLSVSCMVLTESIYGGCAASCFVSALLMYGVLDQSLTFSAIYSVLSIFLFSRLLKLSLNKFPKTFTIGEAMIIVQGIVLLFLTVILRILHNIGDKSDEEMEFVNVINLTMLSSVGIIVTALIMMDDKKKDLKNLYVLIAVAGTYALVMLQFFIGLDCLITIPSYVFLDVHKAQLFLLWLSLSVIAGLTLMFRTKLTVKATTVTRKVFHVLASLVFLSGFICDVHLMMLAAGFGLAVVILAEALRKSDIEMVSPALQAAFQVYSDDKDVGSFAMTPLYLYVGLACPLILVPQQEGYQLELLSGVLAIGVGDTAASWFGAKYGFNKWADGHKSLQGTAFNMISQVMTVYILELFSLIKAENSLFRSIVAAVISGLVEAKTDQIDNLILPFITIIGFQMTWFLA